MLVRPCDAGAVRPRHEDAPGLFLRPSQRFAHAGIIGDVEFQGSGPGADAFCGGFRRLFIAVGADDRGALGGEEFGTRLADAAAGPHDQDGIGSVLRHHLAEASDIPTHDPTLTLI